MRHRLNSWFHYPHVRRSSAIWGDTPSGLGYSDVALCTLLGRELERSSTGKGSRTQCSVLDLGTYFGHSAFSVVYGAATVRKPVTLRVLSIDIFKQPQWLVENDPAVIKFIKEYGSTEPDAVEGRLDVACSQIGLLKNPVELIKRDVLTLKPQDLLALAPQGYKLIMIDCGKSPELMNRIAEFLTDDRICAPGTIALFQDFFDWHAPWNLYAFWRLLKAGAFSLNHGGKAVTPFAVRLVNGNVGIICDQIKESPLAGETWCTSFTTVENEMAALDHFIQMFRGYGYTTSALNLECMKVGALLRGGRLDEAKTMLLRLDQAWPVLCKDFALQNAYRRYQHLRTGRKDLSQVLDTPARFSRNSFIIKKLRNISAYSVYLRPIRSSQV
jgi:hypothetical protein